MDRMTATQKEQLLSNYGLVTATYDNSCTRQEMTTQELAMLKSLCSSNVFGLHYLCDDMDNINTFNVSYDCKLAQSGSASNGDLFSIWSRNKMEKHVITKSGVTVDKRDYGVRVHIKLLDKLYNDDMFADAIHGCNAEVHNEKNGVEIRFSKFATLTDCLKFIVRMQDALDNVVIDVDAEVTDVVETLAIAQNNVLMIEQKDVVVDDKQSKSKQSKSKRQNKKKKEA